MSVGEIIDELGGTAAVAEALGKDLPVVCNWKSRGRIPSDWWPALISFAETRGITGVTFARLAEVQSLRKARV